MTTVAILPITTGAGDLKYQAVSGAHVAVGKSVGEALDALTAELPEMESEGLVVVQRFLPDRFFSAERQQRLQELMRCWREARDRGETLTEAEGTELEALVAAELAGSAQRAAAIAQGLGR
jgi:hypothetical protein